MSIDSFTFHYVSIKSPAPPPVTPPIIDLHSTMYLLNQNRIIELTCSLRYLHSTMYLLNPVKSNDPELQKHNLHSTMYLLNHRHHTANY